ncbi:tRNA-dihydrouridine synthase, partial [Akkermansiaceae bacterium]|nr:tRNA-dihydrouridine synthase [Akkermansiaceae bacterium]
SVKIPVIGNGDINSSEVLKHRMESTAVSGVMIGRAAMQNPWLFKEAKHFLKTGEILAPPSVKERWSFVIRHCELAVGSDRYGDERHTLMAMRSRLMTYCKGFPGAKPLRQRLSQVKSVDEVREIAVESGGS